ncbi:tyrosine-protein phosphatase [uncultured Desulfovibrio sp.]|uniref:Tyrosine-protein phosphatase n=1 Tax=Candidatus Desulfovibrio intestinavium TaxID=2838534 RepID=A0A9D2KRJ5_9BACT|nr:tyrosine-protein phosphatase [uncultured Desulfovibrio sp.]HJA78451.1 tyrosine-protein phosphatase [Candidatus Desulfovibrio intestinavium]
MYRSQERKEGAAIFAVGRQGAGRRLLQFCLLWLCLALVCGMGCAASSAAGTRPPEWARPLAVEGLPNLHKVSDRLYRSGQPTAEGMRAAERLGIRTVISLRSRQRDVPLSADTDLLLHHVPMRAWHPRMASAADALNAILASPGPVLVHCWHGADRTGMVVALYRMVEQGWPREAAIGEMLEGGYGYHRIWKDIISFLEEVDLDELRRAMRRSALPAAPLEKDGKSLEVRHTGTAVGLLQPVTLF